METLPAGGGEECRTRCCRSPRRHAPCCRLWTAAAIMLGLFLAAQETLSFSPRQRPTTARLWGLYSEEGGFVATSPRTSTARSPFFKIGLSKRSEDTAEDFESRPLGDDPTEAVTASTTTPLSAARRSDRDVGGYDPSEKIEVEREVNVGDPQIKVKEKERSVTSILKELAAIQQQGPQKYCILGTRHCSYLHQQIIELLAYALVLSGNHVYTSGAGGTHAATIRGALRAERPDLLTVVLPQSMGRQTKESQELLKSVEDVITMPQNDDMSLDVASRICNSYLLQQTDQLISFAFHESSTVIEATKEAKKLDMLVTVLYLD